MKKGSKVKKGIKYILFILAFIFAVVLVIYINLKNFTVKKIIMNGNQEIYVLGTFHKEHFERYANYSINEMINAIDNIEPDVVFIEAREESFAEYGVVDGPIDMCIAYSYCMDKDIPIEMVDYWKVDNNYKANTTNDDRDDHIHENIMKKMNLYENRRIMVICGFGHLNAQTKRLLADGGKKEKIKNISALFQSDITDFSYPPSIYEVWEQRALFYGHTFPNLVQADDSINDEIKAMWQEDENNDFYNRQMEYCELFKNDRLYME